jgi:hypothetical protein
MKKILLILLLCPILGLAQDWDFPRDPQTNKITYERSSATKLKKATLYLKIKEWVATKFPESSKTIQLDDKSSGVIIGKSYADFEYPTNTIWTKYHIEYSIKLSYKDFKYRCQFTDILISSNDDPKLTPVETTINLMSQNERQKPKIHGLGTQFDLKFITLISSLIEIVNLKDNF